VHVTPADLLLEVGPGTGALTERLYGIPARFVAVEIDRDLAPRLAARFPDLELHNEDILRADLAALLATGSWRVVGNLPYNISTPLLVRLLDHTRHIQDMHFMLQLEVAQRLAASPGTKAWGRLSVLAQFRCDIEVLFEVAPESFTPPPAVWSAVVRLVPHNRDWGLTDDTSLVDIVRLAFGQRRKRVANALKSLALDWPRIGVDPQQRPDQLQIADFVAIAKFLEKQP
jgi:16S rRNA (adenine1518-N6/adenine1519-N6)-dimethyltransferase